jgi:hypothetical protein
VEITNKRNMKKVEIRQFSFAEVDAPKEQFGFMKVPSFSKLIRAEGDNLEVSDGYHTFDELYEHRITLFIALCKAMLPIGTGSKPWRSKLHSDGSSFDGWFILGLNKEKGKQITYHLPIEKWEDTIFAETLENAPEWDGHTANDVLGRINLL